MAYIALRDITKHFANTTAVDHLSLEVADGDFLALLGPSGCGKTTVLRIIAGLERASSGQVVIDDREVTDIPARDRNLAMVFQSYALYPHMSVAKNLSSGLRFRRRSIEEIKTKTNEIAEQLQLIDLLDRKPKELSGGQRQRVALGRAMVRDPEAFLMDEPLSNLDAQLRTATRAELSELHRRLGATFIYVTHDQIEAMAMASRVAIMNKGRLEQVGTPEDIYEQPATTFVAGFVGAPSMNLFAAEVHTENGRVIVSSEGFKVPLREGAQAGRPVVLGVRPEELFLEECHTDAFEVTVRTVEYLGNEKIAICDVRGGRTRLTWRIPRSLGVRPGDSLRLRAAPTSLHLFDPTSNRRLVWTEDDTHRRLPRARDIEQLGDYHSLFTIPSP